MTKQKNEYMQLTDQCNEQNTKKTWEGDRVNRKTDEHQQIKDEFIGEKGKGFSKFSKNFSVKKPEKIENNFTHCM